MIGIGRRAIADDFRDRDRAARQRMIERLDHDNARALAHHEAITVDIERPRRPLRRVVEAGRKGTGRSETAEARPCRYTPRRPRRLRCPPRRRGSSARRRRWPRTPAAHAVTGAPIRPLKPCRMVTWPAARLTRNDGTVKGERRRDAADFRGPHSIGDAPKAADPRRDDGRRPHLFALTRRMPSGLSDRSRPPRPARRR